MTFLQSLIGFHAPLQLEIGLRIILALTVVAGCTLLLQRVGSGDDAVARHRMLSFALVAMLGTPLLAFSLPIVPIAYDLPASFVRIDNAPHAGPVRLFLAELLGVRGGVASAGSTFPGPGPLAWVALVWVVGVIVLAGRHVVALLRVRKRRLEEAFPAPHRLRRIAEHSRKTAGVRRPIVLALTDAYDVPVTFGLRRPVILLPSAALHWREATAAAAVEHEIAHVARHDWLWQLIGLITCAVFWFHPLVWLVARAQRQTAEFAADGHVMAAGTRASAYARALVEIATRRPVGLPPRSTVTLAPASTLERRVTALARPRRASRARTWLLLLVVGSVVTATGVSAPVLVGGCHAEVLSTIPAPRES